MNEQNTPSNQASQANEGFNGGLNASPNNNNGNNQVSDDTMNSTLASLGLEADSLNSQTNTPGNATSMNGQSRQMQQDMNTQFATPQPSSDITLNQAPGSGIPKELYTDVNAQAPDNHVSQGNFTQNTMQQSTNPPAQENSVGSADSIEPNSNNSISQTNSFDQTSRPQTLQGNNDVSPQIKPLEMQSAGQNLDMQSSQGQERSLDSQVSQPSLGQVESLEVQNSIPSNSEIANQGSTQINQASPSIGQTNQSDFVAQSSNGSTTFGDSKGNGNNMPTSAGAMPANSAASGDTQGGGGTVPTSAGAGADAFMTVGNTSTTSNQQTTGTDVSKDVSGNKSKKKVSFVKVLQEKKKYVLAGLFAFILVTLGGLGGFGFIAKGRLAPEQVLVSTVGTNTFTVSFFTEWETNIEVVVSADQNFSNPMKFYDERDYSADGATLENKTKRNNHIVVVRDLEPEKEYYYKINTTFNTFVGEGTAQTSPIEEDIPTPDPIFGTVLEDDGGPKTDALIEIFKRTNSGRISSTIVTYMGDNGSYSADLANLRDVDTGEIFKETEEETSSVIVVARSKENAYQKTINGSDYAPVGTFKFAPSTSASTESEKKPNGLASNLFTTARAIDFELLDGQCNAVAEEAVFHCRAADSNLGDTCALMQTPIKEACMANAPNADSPCNTVGDIVYNSCRGQNISEEICGSITGPSWNKCAEVGLQDNVQGGGEEGQDSGGTEEGGQEDQGEQEDSGEQPGGEGEDVANGGGTFNKDNIVNRFNDFCINGNIRSGSKDREQAEAACYALNGELLSELDTQTFVDVNNPAICSSARGVLSNLLGNYDVIFTVNGVDSRDFYLDGIDAQCTCDVSTSNNCGDFETMYTQAFPDEDSGDDAGNPAEGDSGDDAGTPADEDSGDEETPDESREDAAPVEEADDSGDEEEPTISCQVIPAGDRPQGESPVDICIVTTTYSDGSSENTTLEMNGVRCESNNTCSRPDPTDVANGTNLVDCSDMQDLPVVPYVVTRAVQCSTTEEWRCPENAPFFNSSTGVCLTVAERNSGIPNCNTLPNNSTCSSTIDGYMGNISGGCYKEGDNRMNFCCNEGFVPDNDKAICLPSGSTEPSVGQGGSTEPEIPSLPDCRSISQHATQEAYTQPEIEGATVCNITLPEGNVVRGQICGPLDGEERGVVNDSGTLRCDTTAYAPIPEFGEEDTTPINTAPPEEEQGDTETELPFYKDDKPDLKQDENSIIREVSAQNAENEQNVQSGDILQPGSYKMPDGTVIEIVNPREIIFFVDANGNGIKDANEEVVNDQVVELTKTKTITYNLNAGWNTMNIPGFMNENTYYNASDVIAFAAGQDVEITSIKSWNGAWEEYTALDGGTFSGGMQINPNKGYFVFAENSGSVTLEIITPSTSIPTNLINGWSLVGFAPGYNEEGEKQFANQEFIDSIDSFELMEVANAIDSEINMNNVTRWDSGVYRGVNLIDDKKFGISFNVREAEAYFVRSDKQTVFVP